MDDMELLQEWVDHGSEDAFRSIVDRHVNLVYSTARRLVSNPHEAEEVTQTVFILLARKARSLSKETVMAGWLYRATRFAAAQMLRTESRRRQRLEDLPKMNPRQSQTGLRRAQKVGRRARSDVPARSEFAATIPGFADVSDLSRRRRQHRRDGVDKFSAQQRQLCDGFAWSEG